jgi:hypothetical protein
MADNFKTLAGALTVLGLMGLPLHLFAHRRADDHRLGSYSQASSRSMPTWVIHTM